MRRKNHDRKIVPIELITAAENSEKIKVVQSMKQLCVFPRVEIVSNHRSHEVETLSPRQMLLNMRCRMNWRDSLPGNKYEAKKNFY